MTKKKKILLFSTAALLTGASVSVAVACGAGSSGTISNESKEIVIAVDAPNKDMYDYVKAQFDKTDYHTKMGYSIKFVNRDVFAALDTQAVGHTASIVPDIFYAPQDRVTDLVQRNVVTDLTTFDPGLFNNIEKSVSATPAEITAAREWGTITGAEQGDKTFKPVTKLFAIRHNTEGIVLASTNTLEQLKTDLAKPENADLTKLAQQGKGLFRIQDFWYGNGVLGGAFNKIEQREKLKDGTLMSKILYTKDGKAASGFISTDENNKYFKEAINVAAGIYFPAWSAAYNMNEEQYKSSVFSKRGIGQDELKRFLTADMSSVQDLIWKLMKEKKVEYAIIGTWDIQNALKSADAKSFVNVINTKGDNPYLQASGSWSYLINSRNNGASKEKKEALQEVLKLIFSEGSYYRYFKSDSKVPFYNDRKKEVKELQATEATIPLDNLKKAFTGLGYKDLTDFYKTYNSELAKIAVEKAKIFSSWEVVAEPKKPLDDKNVLPAPVIDKTTFPLSTAENLKTLNDSFAKSTGLRNAISAILGVELDKLKGNEQSWQVGADILKDGISFDVPKENQNELQKLIAETKQSANTLNVRKLEKYIFGVNGDESGDKDAILTKIQKAIAGNTLDALEAEIVANAKKVATNLAKSAPSDEVIKKAVDLYFANYVNTAKLRTFIEKYTTESNMPKGAGEATNPNQTIAQIIELVGKYELSLAADRVINVITSEKTIADGGQGILKTQKNRIDQSNPQFSRVWTSWNDNTFGNVTFLQELGKSTLTEEQFGDKIASALSGRFKALTDALNASATSGGGIVIFQK